MSRAELVKKLQLRRFKETPHPDALCLEAADRIEALEAQLAGRKAVPVEHLLEVARKAISTAREYLEGLNEWFGQREAGLTPDNSEETMFAQVHFRLGPIEAVESRLTNYLSEAQEGEGEKLGDKWWAGDGERGTRANPSPDVDPNLFAHRHIARAEKAAGATPALLGQSFDAATFERWQDWSRRDDALKFFVPSDIRQMLGEIERLRAYVDRLIQLLDRAPDETRAIDAELARCAAAPPGPGWQMMETAPNDGTRILAEYNEYGVQVIRYKTWNNDPWGNGPGGCWLPEANHIPVNKNPLHWQPLPMLAADPPSTGEGER